MMEHKPPDNEPSPSGCGAIVMGGTLVLLGVMVFSTLISPFGDPRLTVLCGLGLGLVSVMLLIHDESRQARIYRPASAARMRACSRPIAA